MKRIWIVIALISAVGLVTVASDDVRNARVSGLQHLADGPADPGDRATYLIEYFDESNDDVYNWNGTFYMSNMFKPAAAGVPYPFGVMTVEVFPFGLDASTATGVGGVIDGVRVFLPDGLPAVDVAAEQLNVAGFIKMWNPVTFTAGTAAVVNSGDFYAGMWNSTSIDMGLQGHAIGWTAPPVEPLECINTSGGGGSAGAPGPWALHSPGDCGDQYGTTSATAVRVTLQVPIPVELMRFSVE